MTPPPKRKSPEQKYEVAPLELFFDLVFVFAVAQLSHHLLENLSWRGMAETLVLLLAVFAVWSYTSWAATMVPVDEPRTRRMVLAVMLLGLFMNAAIPEAFGEAGWAFVIPLLLILLGRTVWTIVNAPNGVYREQFYRTLLWFIAASPFWIAGAAANPEARLLWWALATVIEQVGTWLAHPIPGRWLRSENVVFAGGHMLERCRLFLIVALGETILTTGAAISAAPTTLITLLTGAVALVGTVALWALGFGRAARVVLQFVEETRDPVRASRHAINTLMVMVAGLIAVAVANEEVIAHPHEHASVVLAVLLCGGPMLYLLAQGWYYRYMLQIWPRMRLIGSAGLLGVGFIAMATPLYVALILVGAILTALAIVDRP